MNLATWARRNGVAQVTAYRWFHAGVLPVPAQKSSSFPTGARFRRFSSYWTPRLSRPRVCGDSLVGACRTRHQRDDNAAINLARYEDTDTESGSAVGPVGAAVKRGADHKTRPRPAGGCEARKGGSHTAAKQPRDGVRVA
jgi:hypothetical protein